MTTLQKLLELLSPHERKRAALLLVMILVTAMLDAVGVASIMPFMAVLANPQLVETNVVFSAIYAKANLFGVTDTDQFLFVLGVFTFTLLVVSLSLRAIATYMQVRFVLMLEYSIGRRLVEGYLHQPYTWFLDRNSSDLGKTVLSEVNLVIHHAVTPMLTLISQGLVVIAMLTLVLIVDPVLALTVGAVLGAAYGVILKLVSGFLGRIGAERVEANGERFAALNEAFDAVKEVKIGGLEQVYISRFSAPAVTFARHQAAAQAVALLPRFLLEAVAFGGMILLVLILMARSGGFASALPIIALYAFAGYRLMPSLQQIYASISALSYAAPALDALHKDLVSLKAVEPFLKSTAVMQFKQAITLNNIVFTYPKADQPSLNKISLEIWAHSTVGLVGSTGSGKTTTVDLILGLLEPQKGTLEVDGQVINSSNRSCWQRVIGYIPQQIFLADDSLAANIAFGVESNSIDQAAVERSAKIANLHEFVINELPQAYATTVGERGVRLSGGQRQRIGIARALYHNPQVLILDEATSALDNLTEQAVMEAINNLGREITIILIAHRLSTVRHCDHIYMLEKGKIKAQGNYEELNSSSQAFQKMTGKIL